MQNSIQIEAVNRVQKYIQQNVKKRMSLYEIAQASGYSPWHISKLFKEHTGKNIFDYIRSYRLTQAALILRDEEAAVIDVALEFMFDTHEGFTRAFAKEFGINPKKYALKTPPIRLFLPQAIVDRHKINKGIKIMTNESKTRTVFVQVINRPARKAIIKRGVKAEDYFAYCEEVPCEVWNELCSIKDALNEPMGLWLPQHLIKPGTSKYVQGVEVAEDYAKEAPEGYEIIELKACKMMIFQGPRYDDANFEEEVGLVMKAVREYDPTLFGFEWAENDGPRFQFEPQGSQGYIEGKPVKSNV